MADGPRPGDWRQQVPSSAPKAAGKAWQSQTTPVAAKRAPLSRTSKLGITFGSLALLLGLLVVVLRLLIPISPACLVLIGAGYEDNLSLDHNAHGWNSLQELDKLADSSVFSSWLPWAHSGKMRLHLGPETVDTQNDWDKTWKKLTRNFREETALIVISLHGGSDGTGPYLLADDPRGAARVSVKKIIQDLGTGPFKDKNKVLILDATQMHGHWPSGLLHNDFAHALRELDKEIAGQPGLVVLCASDVDQISWPSDEWRRTIFLHYVIEGLNGAARHEGRDRVNALELFRYVHGKVKNWVFANREAVQEPILLGGEERAASIELVQITTEQDPGGAPGATFLYPAELEKAWEECQALADTVPSPAVYSPHLWRLYRDTLLRYEQLVRAGDTRKASDLRGTLGSLKERILSANRVDLASPALPFALPLARVLGFPEPWKGDEAKAPLNRLWEAGADQREKAWSAVASDAKARGEGVQLARARLSEELLRQLVERDNVNKEDLVLPEAGGMESRGRALLRLVEKLGGARSAEAHFLVMLLQDLDSAAPFSVGLLQEAIKTRVQAERAALSAQALAHKGRPVPPYAELVFPWIRARIEEADQQRRFGEDWLFGSDQTALGEARKKLEQARAQYGKTDPDGKLLRDALHTRDRVLADLPYYARWVARQQEDADVKRLVGQVQDLARRVHQLAGLLEGHQVKSLDEIIPLDNRIDRLTLRQVLLELVAKIDADFDGPDTSLKATLDKICEDSLNAKHTQKHWHKIEDALSVPTIDPQKRKELTKISRNISGELNKSQLAADKQNPNLNNFVERQQKLAREVAERQQTLALAVLGPFTQDLKLDPGSKPSWPDTVVRTGSEIGKFWQTLPETVNDEVSKSLAAEDLKQAQALLDKADGRCRLLHGGGAARLKLEPVSAPDGLRRLRLRELLVWQTRRTMLDHWYADRDGLEKTFYVPAAKAYLKAARALVEISNDADLDKKRQADTRKLEEWVAREEKEPAGIGLKSLAQKDWTSELQFPVQWKVVVADGVPLDGVPMARLELQKPLRAVETKAGRKPLVNWPLDPIGYTLERPEPEKFARGAAKLTVTYRGQHEPSKQDIELHREPDTIAHQVRPPNKAGFAVRMDKDFTYGSVAIVLDTSSSMNEEHPAKGSGVKRWDYATRALQTALESIPKGTYVSLIVYENDKGSKRTVPTLLFEPQPWDETDIKQLMRTVKQIDIVPPGGIGSPIAESLVFALKKGFPRTEKHGPRLILAVTDGDDIYWSKKKIRDELKASFADDRAEIQMVCFNPDLDGEAKSAREQFKDVIENELDPAGKFIPEPDGVKLATTVKQAILPHVRLFQGSSPVPGFLPLPADLPGRRETQWRVVKPGIYDAQVRKSQPLSLEPGDLLQLSLKRDGSKVFLERTLMGPQARGKLPTQDAAGWVVSVPQNEDKRADNRLEQLVTIEEKPVAAEAILKQIHPGFLWMELAAAGAGKRGPLRWYKEFTYPAPAFRLETRDWPLQDGQAAPAELKLWWQREKYPRNEAYTYLLEQTPTRPKKLRVGTTEITIESIERNEKHKVSDSPWTGDKVLQPCVVVRIAHDPGKPVWVQVMGQDAAHGEEHHYYSSVSKYTAYFWGLASNDVDRLAFNVISLADLKASRTGVTFSLPSPSPVPGPTPILKLIQER